MRKPRLEPLEPEALAAHEEIFSSRRRALADLPNSVRTFAHAPQLLAPMLDLWRAVMYEGQVAQELKWLVGHLASRAHGCLYCSAHTAKGAAHAHVPQDKIEAVWSFETSALFSPAERAALRLAFEAAMVPNAVTDETFVVLREHFSSAQIAEILAVVALYGFYNRWNDSIGTQLEAGA